MDQQQRFSNVTNAYLRRFYEILEDMESGMCGAELNDSLSHNFIVQMIPHHRAAIEMSRKLLQYTTCLPLQKIAEQIVMEQTRSIEKMEAALGSCSALANTRADLLAYKNAFCSITGTMFTGMKNARPSNSINISFMREMIPHHEGAIRMSENALRFPICPALVPILRAIITSQERGVRQMQALLHRLENP